MPILALLPISGVSKNLHWYLTHSAFDNFLLTERKLIDKGILLECLFNKDMDQETCFIAVVQQ